MPPDVGGIGENRDMGRGDGSGRIVSREGADDSGTGILHVDMDAFYAAVEVLHDPSLRGLPLIIGGREGRSVVSSASYEARRFGVRSAMPVSQALRLCPSARVVPPDFTRYRAASEQVMGIFESITPLVEPLSIDEAFLDVRGVRRLWGSPGEIAVLNHRVIAVTPAGSVRAKPLARQAEWRSERCRAELGGSAFPSRSLGTRVRAVRSQAGAWERGRVADR